MSARSYTFTHAVTREPSASITEGLRAVDIGTPSLELFQQHHADYVAALKSTGAKVTVLGALDEFPDSTFIEDAALCLPEVAITMRPGAPSRLGEAETVRQVLSELYPEVLAIDGPGFIDGGDILVTEREILIGTSARTDSAGINELRGKVAPWGYKVRELQTPEGVLHFKTDCSLLDEDTILSTMRLAESGCFEGYKVVLIPEGEEAGANAIRFNNLVVLPDGFPKTEQLLRDAGYTIRKVVNTEAAKLDGGMSCLSLRFSPPAA